MLDYQETLATIPNGRNYKSYNADLISEFASRPSGVYKVCGEQFANYELAAVIHGQILFLNGSEDAKSFRNLIMQRAISAEEMYSEYFARIKMTEQDFIESYIIDGKYDGAPASIMPIFMGLVDFGNVCESSILLFQNIATHRSL